MIKRSIFDQNRDKALCIAHLADYIVYRALEKNITLSSYKLQMLAILMYLWNSNHFYFDHITISSKMMNSWEVEERYSIGLGSLGIWEVPCFILGMGETERTFDDPVLSYDKLKEKYYIFDEDIDYLLTAITGHCTEYNDCFWKLNKLYNKIVEDLEPKTVTFNQLYDLHGRFATCDKRKFLTIEAIESKDVLLSYECFNKEIAFEIAKLQRC